MDKKCKDCGDVTDDLNTEGQCMICWHMEKEPELFITTKKDWEDMEKCADYIKRVGLTPSLDIPLNED